MLDGLRFGWFVCISRMGDVVPDIGHTVEVEKSEGREGDRVAIACENDVEVGDVSREVRRSSS